MASRAPVTSAAVLLVMADAIEVSREHERIALYQWREILTDVAFERAWTENDGQSVHDGRTMYALLDLARKAGLTVAAWKDGVRIA
jgi:hypothetical protein